MTTRGVVFIAVALFSATPRIVAQDFNELPATRAISFGTSLQSSVNSLAAVSRFDVSGAYQFQKHWQLTLGVPFYFIDPRGATASAGYTSARGLGNVYTALRYTHLSPRVNYASTLTATAPTGDRSQGLSNGHVTVDWTNSFDRTFGRVTPFADIGAASAVSDTMYFVRAYTSSGFITHGQGGVRFRVAKYMSVGGAGYFIEPAGTQTVISRVVTRKNVQLPVNVPGSGLAKGVANRVFETTAVSTGASLARDRGASAFVVFGKNPGVNFYGGYTHSSTFDLHTVFFGAGFNVRKPLGGI